ncbi:MAG TPA: hypothetical protein VE912_04310 [Bacteroidales bacterium]|nr:hypothetical protein [Bacteroidales bacterium]
MSVSEINDENLRTYSDTTMSTASTGVISILPLLAATSIGASAPIHMEHYPSSSNEHAQVERQEKPLEYLQISETNFNNISYASVDYLDIQSEAKSEFQILHGFVTEILNDSKPQPGDLKSRMYENIDDLLIG